MCIWYKTSYTRIRYFSGYARIEGQKRIYKMRQILGETRGGYQFFGVSEKTKGFRPIL